MAIDAKLRPAFVGRLRREEGVAHALETACDEPALLGHAQSHSILRIS